MKILAFLTFLVASASSSAIKGARIEGPPSQDVVIQGPSAKASINGPDGSHIDYEAPGGTIVAKPQHGGIITASDDGSASVIGPASPEVSGYGGSSGSNGADCQPDGSYSASAPVASYSYPKPNPSGPSLGPSASYSPSGASSGPVPTYTHPSSGSSYLGSSSGLSGPVPSYSNPSAGSSGPVPSYSNPAGGSSGPVPSYSSPFSGSAGSSSSFSQSSPGSFGPSPSYSHPAGSSSGPVPSYSHPSGSYSQPASPSGLYSSPNSGSSGPFPSASAPGPNAVQGDVKISGPSGIIETHGQSSIVAHIPAPAGYGAGVGASDAQGSNSVDGNESGEYVADNNEQRYDDGSYKSEHEGGEKTCECH